MFGQELEMIGLTKGESKVYEALLVLEDSTVGPIVKKSGVSYSKIYEILDKLTAKGLVSYSIKENTKYFQATNPNRLRDYVATQERKASANKELLQKILPLMQNMRLLAGKKEGAEIFIGIKGLTAAYETLLELPEKGEEECFFYAYDPAYHDKSLSFYTKMFHYFKETGVKMRGIGGLSYKNTELAKETEKASYRQRYVEFPVPGNIDIYKDMVLIINWSSEPVGILIRSEEIAENFRNYFNAVWAIAKS